MKTIHKLLPLFLFSLHMQAGAQTTEEFKANAAAYTRKADYANAILVLNRAINRSPEDASLKKELAFNFYLKGDIAKAKEIIMPLTNRDDAEVTTFQVAANVLRAEQDYKELEKLYKKGLKKFPASGPLHSEYGEMLFAKQDYNAIKYWEKGIELAPSYSMNYYHAAKYYYFTTEKVKGLLYGEIFTDLESFSPRTKEIKSLLFEGYKKLFSDPDLLKTADKNSFYTAFLTTMQKQAEKATGGINTESLHTIRTGFITQWFKEYAATYPYRLFEYQKQLIEEGIFEAYSQWLFGEAENPSAYQNWVQLHKEENDKFLYFIKGRVFKLPAGQYY